MLCSNCGKQIPSAGQACPHCRADKSKGPPSEVLLMCGGALLGLPVAVLCLMVGDLWLGVLGLFGGATVGMLAVALLTASTR